jgi:hypothetical protein
MTRRHWNNEDCCIVCGEIHSGECNPKRLEQIERGRRSYDAEARHGPTFHQRLELAEFLNAEDDDGEEQEL